MFFFDPVKFSSGYCLEGDKITFLFDSVKFPSGFSFLGENVAFSPAPPFCLEGEKSRTQFEKVEQLMPATYLRIERSVALEDDFFESVREKKVWRNGRVEPNCPWRTLISGVLFPVDLEISFFFFLLPEDILLILYPFLFFFLLVSRNGLAERSSNYC